MKPIFNTIVFVMFLICYGISDAAEKPVVLWSSSPVNPGETIVLFGGNWNASAKVVLDNGKESRTVEPLSVTETGINVVSPKDWAETIISGRVLCDGRQSEPFFINKPKVWWLQGDWGSEASPDGWIRIFGTGLYLDSGTTKIILRGKNGQQRALGWDPQAMQSRWTVAAELKNLEEGEYDVLIENGFETETMEKTLAGKIRVAKHEEVWKTDMFNVVDFGAIPNDGLDDTRAVKAALEAITKNEGGILYFPRGRFQINEMLTIPPNTLIKGASRELSQLYWPDTYTPPEALIRGTHSFGITDLTITSGNHLDGIVSNTLEDKENGNITLDNVCIRLLFTQYLYITPEETWRRTKVLHHKRVLRLGGDFVRITGCDIHTQGGGEFEIGATNAYIAHNRFSKGLIGWNGFNGKRMIFMMNDFAGPCCTSFYGRRDGSSDIYWGENKQPQNFDGNNRESITGDGRFHTYLDTAVSWEPTAVVVKPITWQRGVDLWRNGKIQLLNGKGVGQIRTITKIDGNRIEFDRPWDIQPDTETLVSIATLRERFLYVNNETGDSSIGLQFYGSMVEGIVADNTFTRTGGVNADAMAAEPGWFTQILNNTIVEGNAYRGPRNEVPATDAHFAFLDHSPPGPLKYSQVRAGIMRCNDLWTNSRITVRGPVDGILLENNTIKSSDVGISVAADSKNVVLRGNRFEDVSKPYQIVSESVLLTPKEEIAAAISGASTMLGDAVPKMWTEILVKLDAPDDNQPADSLRKQAIELLENATKILAESRNGKPVSAEVVDVLLGAVPQTPNWSTTDKFLKNGDEGKFPLLLRVLDNARIPVSITLAPEPGWLPDGWTFEVSKFNTEPGKHCDRLAVITKPAGKTPLLAIPLRGEISGKDWKLPFTMTLKDRGAVQFVGDWLVAGPIPNTTGKNMDSIFELPKLKIDPKGKFKTVDGEGSWTPCPLEGGRLDFGKRFGLDTDAVVYAISAVEAKRPIQVRFSYTNNCLLYVNSNPVGTTLGRGQWGCVNLNEGINTLMLVSIGDKKRKEWKVGQAEIRMVDPLRPGDLTTVSCERLAELAY